MKEGLDPLHILPPLTLMILIAAFLLMALVVAGWMLLYFIMNRKKPAPLPVSAPKDVRERLREVDADASLSKDYRLSLHRISGIMRQHLTRTTAFPFFSSVLYEIRRVIPVEEPTTVFFDEVDRLRFQRNPPDEKAYRKVKDRAEKLVGREGILRRLLGRKA